MQNLRRVLNAVFAIRYHDPSKVSLFDKKKTRLGSGFLISLRTKLFCHMVTLVAICISWLVTSKGVLFAARRRNEFSFSQARFSSFEKKKTRLEIPSDYCVIDTQGSFSSSGETRRYELISLPRDRSYCVECEKKLFHRMETWQWSPSWREHILEGVLIVGATIRKRGNKQRFLRSTRRIQGFVREFILRCPRTKVLSSDMKYPSWTVMVSILVGES